jgi:hypothetical protein
MFYLDHRYGCMRFNAGNTKEEEEHCTNISMQLDYISKQISLNWPQLCKQTLEHIQF